MATFSADDLKRFSAELLNKAKVPSEDAAVVADVLVQADLEGIVSHGISRLPIYLRRLMEGRINPRPNISFIRNSYSVLIVNGDNGLGQVVMYKAVKEGMKIARKNGVCAIGINHSNHFGTASYYCKVACDEKMISVGFTNSPSGIAPWGSKKAFFGTNPIAFGFPTGNRVPIIIDLSTSIVARGKIILAAKQGKPIPNGWAVDCNGEVTNDPNKALKGAVLPMGGAKGSALALAVEILTGILSGAAYGPHINNIYNDGRNDPANVGHFFILIDIEKFMPFDLFTQRLSTFIGEMKELPKTPGTNEIRYPGEGKFRNYIQNIKNGISLSSEVEQELKLLSEQLKVSFPSPIKR
ncbi:Ldh family oxidoreductase [Geobacillus thermodenitrificans]|uniref:Ldh family oxidoreductase n=1 Tax=Geobacillus thermodenitrificans TaxID=33940 RepID=UPI002E224E87|nr:Ldh family oxidoreductase [Geobacillus thermodenitrificans]